MRKTCFLVFLFMLQFVYAQDTLTVRHDIANDSINLQVVKDSLHSTNPLDSIFELYSADDTLKLIITDDTIHEIVPRSMAMPEEPDTLIQIQSLLNDSIQQDSTVIDSTQILLKTDSLHTDSISMDSIKIRQNLNAIDSLMQKATEDSLRQKFIADSLSKLKPKVKVKKRRVNPILVRFNKEMAEMRVSYFAYFRMWDDMDAPTPKVKYNPDYYKLFVAPTFYHNAFEEAYELNWEPKKYGYSKEGTDSIYHVLNQSQEKPYKVPCIETIKKVDRWANNILLSFYMEHPEMVTGNEIYLADLTVLDDSKPIVKKEPEKVISLLEPENAFVDNIDSDNEFIKLKPNFWKFDGNSSLHFTQNYISDNWYQGGESTNALVSGLIWNAKYNDKRRGIEFDNRVEVKLGFTTAPSDTMHSYRTNADMFRLNSKIGIRAIKNWYYTFATEFKTQFFSNYKMNSNEKVSSFLTPAQLNITLGMDFKKNNKNYSLSLMGSPFAYNLYYIHDKDITKNKGAFNVEKGKRSANMFGSQVKGNLTWKIMKNIKWTSIFDYFTTYEKVIVNWENTFDFILNRHLSTKIFLHARYDDGVKLNDDNHSYFQFKEMLTFGLTYNW